MEKHLEQKLKNQIKALGGLCLKWVSPGFTGVPDRIVLLPGGRIYLVELKYGLGGLSRRQQLVKKQLARLGFEVHIVKGEESLTGFLKLVSNDS